MKLLKKSLLALLGTILLSFGAASLLTVGFGADVLSALAAGISRQVGLPFSICLLTFNLTAGIIIFFISKHRIGIGTAMNIVLVGFFIEWFSKGLKSLPTDWTNWTNFIPLLTIGLMLYALGISLYTGADFGAGPYDAIPLVIYEKTNIKFFIWRVGVDVTCLIISLLLGGPIGIMTVVTSFILGPLITVWNKLFVTNLFNKIAK
jgi:uncharacterized membrane protein YczE